MKNCGEEIRLGKLGVLLYECLGEEYPEVLGSILGGLKAIVNVIGIFNIYYTLNLHIIMNLLLHYKYYIIFI